ncbi:unnamed protein product [Cyclocybe aegerita]|uniref:F-box domain-containing protein n=1 Tax=Cyclocybe aegerita TaxID=1973307 RepID=A0A8S0X8U3_CYCAE|nr:unnamed protein product [Cyclocybe aegerita]
MEDHSLGEDRTDRTPECQCPSCHKLKSINSKLTEAKQLVEQLVAEKVAIKVELNMAHDPVTGKLPVEVTVRVFSVAMSDWGRLPTPLYEGISRVPLLFGAVSRRWREIAWSTPSLWTEVDICISSTRVTTQMDLLKEWLERSGQLPLLIGLCCSQRCSEIDSIYFTNKAIDILNQHSARWKDLILDIPVQCIRRLGGDVESGSRLTDIAIYPSPEQSQPDRHLTKLHLPNATPRNVTCADLTFRGLEINWAKVTKVDLKLLFVDECLQLFRVAPQLMDCIIGGIVPGSDTYPIPSRLLVLNSLKRLSISFDNVTPSMLLSHIQTPFLEDVIYCGPDLIGLKSLIIRSSCPLSSLSFSFIGAQSPEVVDLLRNTARLKDLDLEYCHLTDEFFDLLATTASLPPGGLGEGFLPLLTQLKISNPTIDFSWNAFASMLAPTGSEPEGNHRRPLSKVSFYLERHLHIGPGPYIDEVAVSRLLKAIQQGVHLSIRQGSGYLDLLEESRKFHEGRHREAEGT